ncbi:MAG TPA: hypothetical protein VLL74_07085, partial [Methanoregula sp.]|nr:hypothetical protein [Methanoregula sp.]
MSACAARAMWRGYSHSNETEGAGRIPAGISFHRILRTLEPAQKHQTEDSGMIFTRLPTFGFSTIGEWYIGHTS